jgi:hypothetical protein
LFPNGRSGLLIKIGMEVVNESSGSRLRSDGCEFESDGEHAELEE